MEYYAIFIPDKKPDFSIKSVYNDKAEALSVLKQHKEARMKAFSSSEEAVSFYLNGPSETFSKIATPTISSPNKPIKPPFAGPTSQKLVAFRKLIEANNISEVCATIQNPRYLVSSGDTPTILKEGPRYNALHVAAIEGRGDICRLILQSIESSAYIEKLHGLRTTATDEVSAILLDLYLNTPDKCRSETPLHFAAKHGSVEVVKELIAYPECQVAPNAEGLFPRDIICSRAKARNDTPEIREAIRVLLDEHFFVPLVRYEDNVIPPTIGKPFSPTRTLKLDEPGSPTTSPRGEVKAYAGPMDRSKADSFYRRWKTPPRLVVVSPNLKQVRSEEPRQCTSSTPIKANRQPRRLFANRSLDHALLEGARCQDASQANDTIDESREELNEACETDANVDSPACLMDGIEEDPVQDSNGNLLPPVVSTPVRLFHQYRNLANDMDSSFDSDASMGEANFSYLCDETRTVYDRSRLRDTPTHKERSLRLSNIDKGLETLGRMLATNENVGWKEHWAFLGKFCDLTNDDGLRLFEQFLEERHKTTTTTQPVVEPVPKPIVQGPQRDAANPFGFSSSMNVLCDNMQRFSIREPSANFPINNDCLLGVDSGQLYGPGDLSSPSQLANPYLCVTSSLIVLATRFTMILQNKSLQDGKKGNGMHGSSLLHVVQKLDTMVENFRADAAFREIDFDKAHTLFAYLILGMVDGRKEAQFAHLVVNDEAITLPMVSTSGDVICSFECVKHFLVCHMEGRFPGTVKLDDTTESDCRRLWTEESLIIACACRPLIGISVARRKKERMKRREERVKRMSGHWGGGGLASGDEAIAVVDYKTYRTSQPTPSPPDTPTGNEQLAAKPIQIGGSSEDEDIYLSCSDSEDGREYGDQDDAFFTPPSSPPGPSYLDGLSCDTNNNAERMRASETVAREGTDEVVGTKEVNKRRCPQVFIAGDVPTKQDFDVWTVLAGVEINATQHPLVCAWKDAMRGHTDKEGTQDSWIL